MAVRLKKSDSSSSPSWHPATAGRVAELGARTREALESTVGSDYFTSSSTTSLMTGLPASTFACA